MSTARSILNLRVLLILFTVAGALLAHAELPVPEMVNPPTNPPGPGIFVPPPDAAAGSNDAPAPLALVPSPEARQAMLVKLQPWPVQTNAWLTLRNADRFEGQFAGLDLTSLAWQLPLVADPVRFRRDQLESVSFPTLGQTNTPPPGSAVVWLRNGDLLTGRQLQFDGQTVSIDADHLGALRLPRAQVRVLYNGAQRRPALLDLLSWDQIRVLPGKGVDIDQRLYRELDWPDPALLEFELPAQEGRKLQLHWPVESPQSSITALRLRLVVEDNRIALLNSYQAQPNWLDLPATTNRAWRIGLWFSRAQGKAALLVDGQVRQQIPFDLEQLPKGRGLAFIHHIELAAEPEVRTIMVTPGSADVAALTNAARDQVVLANGDILAGRVELVSPTSAVVSGALGRAELPSARWVSIHLTGIDPAPPTDPSLVRVWLHGGGHFSGRLRESATDRLSLETDWAGAVTVDRDAVRSLQFGLHLPPPTKYQYDPSSLTHALRPYAPGKMGLVSGARLSGQLVGWTNNLVGWQHPAALRPMLVSQANIAHVNPAAVTNAPAFPSTVELVNGDAIQAELLGSDARQLRLRTAQLGVVNLPASSIRQIYPNQAAGVVETGPPERADRTPETQPEALPRSSLRYYLWTNPVPDRVCVQWELAVPPVRWMFNATVFDPATTVHSADPKRAIWFLSLNSATLGLFDNGGGSLYRGPSTVCLPGINRNGRVRLTWLADRTKSEEFFLVDNQLVNQRQGIKQPATGNSISAVVNLVTLRHVVVEEWRGAAADVAWPATGDAVRLHDWTVLSGPIEGLRDGQVLLGGGRSVPLTKVAALRFDPSTRAPAAVNDPTVQVTLTLGERLSLSGPGLAAGNIVGTVPNIGRVSLPLESVSRVQVSPVPPAAWQTLVKTKTLAERTQPCYKCHGY